MQLTMVVPEDEYKDFLAALDWKEDPNEKPSWNLKAALYSKAGLGRPLNPREHLIQYMKDKREGKIK